MLIKSISRLLALVILSIIPVCAGGNSNQVEELTGTVIAYDELQSWSSCFEGKCESSFIVRIEETTGGPSRYVRVDFSFHMMKGPKELVLKSRLWRFKLIRTSVLDEPLDEFVIEQQSAYNPERKIPIWKIVPGAEGEKLPFGEIVPSYKLVNDGFKLINGTR